MSNAYTPEEIAQHRAEWLAALRSDAYRQTAGALCRVDENGDRSYCCLGVVEVLAGTEEVRHEADLVAFRGVTILGAEHPETATLTRHAQEWLGVDHVSPDLAGDGYWYEPDDGESSPYRMEGLTELNDDGGLTFAQIADLIEAQGIR